MLGASLMALQGVIPRAFTSDPRVIERAQAFWPLFAAMQPVGAAVFALDGILLGAGETDYLAWSMLASSAVYVAVAVLSFTAHWGIVGVWAGFDVLMLVRLASCAARFRSGRWVVVGAG